MLLGPRGLSDSQKGGYGKVKSIAWFMHLNIWEKYIWKWEN